LMFLVGIVGRLASGARTRFDDVSPYLEHFPPLRIFADPLGEGARFP